MTNLPALTGKTMVTALAKAGFEVIRIRGSHHYVRHPDGRSTVVPVHAGETIGPGLINTPEKTNALKRWMNRFFSCVFGYITVLYL